MTDQYPSPTRTSPRTCQRCAERGKSCCELSSGDEEYCFPLSELEMAAIVRAGHDQASCFVQVPNTSNFIDQLALLVPDHDVRARFPLGGMHWRLRTTPQGRCIFLDERGCLLAPEFRPKYCRIFPLWVHNGRTTWFTADDCLAVTECTGKADLFSAMGTNENEILALFMDMCSALGLSDR